MTRETRDRLRRMAGMLQRLGLGLSALLGCMVGLAFARGADMAWYLAFGGFMTIVWVGMASVLLSALSERVPAGAWREGLGLNCRIFLAQATVYGLALLALALTPTRAADPPVALLALAILPVLYLCSVLAILLSAPLYLSWLPVRPDDR